MKEENISGNKRAAKNATLLTLRMILVTIVGLYTSRVVLSVLGETNYGIYGVVGGVVGMIGFLSSSMAGATSRFLTYEMGTGNQDRLSKTFSTTLIAHFIIALFVALFAETFGLWFLNAKVNIPEGRMWAANWVYQFSITSAFLGIIQVPYSATIMAHERMGIYAYLEILNVSLKLVIVYLLTIVDIDKLILYTFLLLAVSALMILINIIYCLRNFTESHFRWVWDMAYMKPIIQFSGLDLYGHMCVTASTQGRTLLINIFFGVLYNTAVAIAQTVQGTIMGLSGTIIMAFKPQIIKLYAQDRIAEMQTVMNNAIKFNLLVYALMAIPCCLEAHYILNLWLGQVPAHSVIFLQVMLLVSFLSSNITVNNAAIHATGNIKRLSYISGTFYLLSPLIIWLAFKLGAPAWGAYVVYGFMIVLIIANALYIIHDQIPKFNVYRFAFLNLKVYVVIFLAAIPIYFFNQTLQESFLRLVLTIIIYAIVLGLASWFLLFTQDYRTTILLHIQQQYRKFFT